MTLYTKLGHKLTFTIQIIHIDPWYSFVNVRHTKYTRIVNDAVHEMHYSAWEAYFTILLVRTCVRQGKFNAVLIFFNLLELLNSCFIYNWIKICHSLRISFKIDGFELFIKPFFFFFFFFYFLYVFFFYFLYFFFFF